MSTGYVTLLGWECPSCHMVLTADMIKHLTGTTEDLTKTCSCGKVTYADYRVKVAQLNHLTSRVT